MIVTGERYTAMLEYFLFLVLENRRDKIMTLLRQSWRECWISKRSAIESPASSPDLTVPNSYLCGYLQENVYTAINLNIKATQGQHYKGNWAMTLEKLEAGTAKVLETNASCEREKGIYVMLFSYLKYKKI